MHMLTCRKLLIALSVTAVMMLNQSPTIAGDLKVSVQAKGGQSLPDLVVYLTAPDGQPIGGSSGNGPISIGQRDIQFIPHLSVVPVGSQIRFINSDTVAHHVFSFSGQAPDNLELVVEPGERSKDYLFSKEGFSKIGCNIHDNMSAFIFAAPSNHVAVTEADGSADIKNIPPGPYKLWIWSSEQIHEPLTERSIQVTEMADTLNIAVPAPKRRRAQRRSFDDY